MTNNWEARFPNKYTRPDPDDPVTKKTRRDAKEIFGSDALEEEIDFPAFLAELQRKHSTPEYQAHAAKRREEEAQRQADMLEAEYRRNIEALSPIHVDAVLAGCTRDLTPITTTDIQRKVIAKWDGVQSLFLLGQTGVGKTYTATWCAMKGAKAGRSVASTTATRVCTASHDGLNVLRSVSVLVLDQLHTLQSPEGRSMPAWQVSPVIDLIDYRYEQKRTTIAAGTISPKPMFDLLGKDVKRRFPVRLESDSTKVRRERRLPGEQGDG